MRVPGLSGFLEYKKLDGSWRPFLFQTIDFQLMVYRVHVRQCCLPKRECRVARMMTVQLTERG